MSDFSVRAVEGTEGTEGAVAPFFSPSGDVVAFFVGSVLKRVSLADGRVSAVASNIGDPWGGAWSPDGRIVVAIDRASRLLVLGPSGDSLRSISCNVGCGFPEMLTEHRVVVTTMAGLHIVDIESGSIAPLVRRGAANGQERVRGMMAKYDGEGRIVYVGPGGQLFAALIDAKRGILTSEPVTIAEGVRVETGRGAAQFALSRAGVLAYVPGPVMSLGILVRTDRTGKLDTIPAPPANYNALELTPDGKRLVVRVGTLTGDASVEVIDAVSGNVTPWLTGQSLGRPTVVE